MSTSNAGIRDKVEYERLHPVANVRPKYHENAIKAEVFIDILENR